MAKVDYQSLIDRLEDGDIHTRQQAHLKLIEAGEGAIPILTQTLSSGNPYLRWRAAKTLSQMNISAVIPILINMLRENEDAGVRWMAAEGLISMGNAGLVPLLRSLIEHSDSVWLREGAHHVLRSLHDRGLESEAIEGTLHALDDIEPVIGVPWAAEETLKHLVP